VTEEMKEEVMELLQLFGVPFIVAPMEAEAQCAELERLGLVEGVVSDDADAFLFGAQRVYKNIFDQAKYVEAYLLRDAELELGIGRHEMISMALLLGSDYTDGVKGVGIVNAMEVVEAFPVQNNPLASLSKFKEWLDGFDPVADILDEHAEILSKFHKRHRNARNRWVVEKSFPDRRIIEAYTNPQVNRSTEPFSVGRPDPGALREFCAAKLGWPFFRTDELIGPVVEQLNAPSRQARIDSFFVSYHDNVKFAKIKSKRLQQAVADLREGGKLRGPTENASKQQANRHEISSSLEEVMDHEQAAVGPGDNENQKVVGAEEVHSTTGKRKTPAARKSANCQTKPKQQNAGGSKKVLRRRTGGKG